MIDREGMEELFLLLEELHTRIHGSWPPCDLEQTELVRLCGSLVARIEEMGEEPGPGPVSPGSLENSLGDLGSCLSEFIKKPAHDLGGIRRSVSGLLASFQATALATGSRLAPVLAVLRGEAVPSRLDLLEGVPVLLGRDPECDLRFSADSLVEPCRCRILSRGGAVHVEALDSSYPIRVNGSQAMEAPLASGDVLSLSGGSAVVLWLPSSRRRAWSDSPIGIGGLSQETDPATLETHSCARCGRTIAPGEVTALGTASPQGARYCLDCVASGEAPFPVLDRYVRFQRLGRGGMGDVFLAVEIGSTRLVAVKTLRCELEEESDSIVRFYREAKLARQVSHPNLVGFVDCGIHEGVPYLVLEFVRGKSVDEILRKKGRLEIPLALQVAYHVARALEHLHHHDIVHRDVKPANILLDLDRTVRLLDLGLAKRMSTSGFSGVTTDLMALGTVAYMPPEQLSDARSADERSDIYSLGATLYHMLTGRAPFERGSAPALLAAILDGRFERPLAIEPRIPPEIDKIVVRAMACEPPQRYPRASILAEDLLAAFSRAGPP